MGAYFILSAKVPGDPWLKMRPPHKHKLVDLRAGGNLENQPLPFFFRGKAG